MPTHDANNGTWYVLRYAEEFIAPTGTALDVETPFKVPSRPYLQPTLLFDKRRGVLELQPEASSMAGDPPQGIALDIDGDIHRVNETGVLIILRCEKSQENQRDFCAPGGQR